MGVSPVDGYGPITQSNAADIYKDREVYNNLEPAQKHLVDRYVTDEEKEQIDYDMRTTDANKKGKDKVEDSKKADKHDNQTANAIGTSVAGDLFAAAIVKLAASCKKITAISGFSALGGAIAMMACSIGALLSVNKFDNGYKDRTSTSDNSGSTNEVLDAQSAALEESMGMMDKDFQEYMKGSQNLMQNTNANNSKLADLQVQLADAKAAGDSAGVDRIKAQIEALQGNTFDKDVENLEEKRKGIEDYRTMGSETDGVIEGGSSVKDFLKEGTPLGVAATLNATWLAVAAVWSGILIAGSFKTATEEATKWNWPGSAAAWAAAAMYAVTLVMLGTATTNMASKAKKEFDCGSNGRDVEDHVNALNDMRDQQVEYTDQTEEGYTEEDENRTENITEGEDMANGNAGDNGGAPINSDPGPKKPKNEGQGSGSKQTSGAAA